MAASFSRPLRIAQVAPLWASVPPSHYYGGTEAILCLLTEELVRRGHEVTLFASGDSKTSARLRAACEKNLMEAMSRGEAYLYEPYANSNFAAALRESDSFDVIHSHIGCGFIPFSVFSKAPVVHTLHIPLVADDRWLLVQYPDVPVVAISRSQIAPIPSERRESIRVIYNGCDLDAHELGSGRGNYLAYLGRMGPHKNPAGAIRIAQEVGIPLLLAGAPQDQKEKRYFAEEVLPQVDGKRIRYIGPVDRFQKNELLKNAAALLFPIAGEEAFGLVMVEAMACGTPVVACNRGAVSEVVDFGTTGFYGESLEDLAELVPRSLALDRRAVRERAARRFSHQRMVEEYIEVYRSLAEQVP